MRAILEEAIAGLGEEALVALRDEGTLLIEAKEAKGREEGGEVYWGERSEGRRENDGRGRGAIGEMKEERKGGREEEESDTKGARRRTR